LKLVPDGAKEGDVIEIRLDKEVTEGRMEKNEKACG
jgi:hypothetical protein